MKLAKVLVASVVVLLVAGLAAAPEALARGGKGGGKGKGKRGKNGKVLDRKTLIQEMEKDTREADAVDRAAAGRTADFEALHRENRKEALANYRRAGENVRRSEDARFEAPR